MLNENTSKFLEQSEKKIVSEILANFSVGENRIIGNVENQISKTDLKITDVKKRIGGVESKVKNIDGKISGIESDLKVIIELIKSKIN